MKKFFYFLAFILVAGKAAGQNYISALEYWFDTAYTARVHQSLIPQHQFMITSSISTTGLEKGLHTYYIRFQQTNGFWSQTVSGFFFKTGESGSVTPSIKSYRYWVEGEDSIVTVNITTPVSPLNLIATLDLSWIDKGVNYLYIQFQDEQGNWSIATVDSFFKSSIPVADFTTNDTVTCNRDSVHFINRSNDADLYLWQFGDGDSSTDAEPVHYYSTPGDYTVTLTVTDTATGEDSTLQLTNLIHIIQGAQASFTFTQNNLQVTFTNTSQFANSYYWDFGDGTHSINTNPVHTYLHDGNHTVVLSVTDSCGTLSDTQVVSMVLNIANSNNNRCFELYLNNTDVKILFRKSMKKCVYSLIDPTGRKILYNRVEDIVSGFNEKFSIENLPAGIYFLHLSNESISETRVIYKL